MAYSIFNFAWDMIVANAPSVFLVACSFALMHWLSNRFTGGR